MKSIRFASFIFIIALMPGLCARAAEGTVAAAIQSASLDQNVGALLPLDATFTDDSGQQVHLRDFMAHRPTVLAFAYFTCPNLCPMLLQHMTASLNGTGLIAGRDFDVVVISIDPAETRDAAQSMKQSCVSGYHVRNTESGWHFLMGSPEQINRLTTAVGYHYATDAPGNKFVHPLGLEIVAPGGKLCHYFYGIDFAPAAMEGALNDAARQKTSIADQPEQQYCLSYTPGASTYGRIAVRALQGVAAFWVTLLAGYIGYQTFIERRRSHAVTARKEDQS